MQTITPFLWFDSQAEDAARFYVSVFGGELGAVTRYGDAGPGPKGGVMTASFEVGGQAFTALNGGPLFPFTEAVSFVVRCKDQAEVDAYWDRLTAGGGKPVQCGWLKDRYGLSWQIVPDRLVALMTDPDRARAGRVAAAMMNMVKIDIAGLEAAAAG